MRYEWSTDGGAADLGPNKYPCGGQPRRRRNTRNPCSPRSLGYRKRVVQGKRLDPGGGSIIKKKQQCRNF